MYRIEYSTVLMGYLFGLNYIPLPVVSGGGVSQGTVVHTGGPVRQEEAWLRAGEAVGGTRTKTFLS